LTSCRRHTPRRSSDVHEWISLAGARGGGGLMAPSPQQFHALIGRMRSSRHNRTQLLHARRPPPAAILYGRERAPGTARTLVASNFLSPTRRTSSRRFMNRRHSLRRRRRNRRRHDMRSSAGRSVAERARFLHSADCHREFVVKRFLGIQGNIRFDFRIFPQRGVLNLFTDF